MGFLNLGKIVAKKTGHFFFVCMMMLVVYLGAVEFVTRS